MARRGSWELEGTPSRLFLCPDQGVQNLRESSSIRRIV